MPLRRPAPARILAKPRGFQPPRVSAGRPSLNSSDTPISRSGAGQLLGWLKCQLPDAKCPRILQLRDSLPLTETGKIAVHMLS